MKTARRVALRRVARDVVDRSLHDDRKDIDKVRSALKSFKPGTGTPYETYRARRLRGSARGG